MIAHLGRPDKFGAWARDIDGATIGVFATNELTER
jgi:hypothetical protein